jgi:hypothetical protein
MIFTNVLMRSKKTILIGDVYIAVALRGLNGLSVHRRDIYTAKRIHRSEKYWCILGGGKEKRKVLRGGGRRLRF